MCLAAILVRFTSAFFLFSKVLTGFSALVDSLSIDSVDLAASDFSVIVVFTVFSSTVSPMVLSDEGDSEITVVSAIDSISDDLDVIIECPVE